NDVAPRRADGAQLRWGGRRAGRRKCAIVHSGALLPFALAGEWGLWLFDARARSSSRSRAFRVALRAPRVTSLCLAIREVTKRKATRLPRRHSFGMPVPCVA